MVIEYSEITKCHPIVHSKIGKFISLEFHLHGEIKTNHD